MIPKHLMSRVLVETVVPAQIWSSRCLTHMPASCVGIEDSNMSPNWGGNMKKTDSQLQQDVLQELKYEPSICPSQIGVTS